MSRGLLRSLLIGGAFATLGIWAPAEILAKTEAGALGCSATCPGGTCSCSGTCACTCNPQTGSPECANVKPK
jgi:hypothetical protein